MFRNRLFLSLLCGGLLIASCSKKHQPQTSIKVTDYPSENSTDSATTVSKPAEKKIVKRAVPRTAVPKAITVDDRAAHTTAEGRKYYDLEGKRYWKNFKDGKYYLFHQNMFDDPAFKPQ